MKSQGLKYALATVLARGHALPGINHRQRECQVLRLGIPTKILWEPANELGASQNDAVTMVASQRRFKLA